MQSTYHLWSDKLKNQLREHTYKTMNTTKTDSGSASVDSTRAITRGDRRLIDFSERPAVSDEHELRVARAFLVYQAGIANVFAVECFNLSSFGREARRIMQGDFRSCENFARGLGFAGTVIRTAHCNEAGNIQDSTWSEDLDAAPFSDQFNAVNMG